jgi:hypothetical protein
MSIAAKITTTATLVPVWASGGGGVVSWLILTAHVWLALDTVMVCVPAVREAGIVISVEN